MRSSVRLLSGPKVSIDSGRAVFSRAKSPIGDLRKTALAKGGPDS